MAPVGSPTPTRSSPSRSMACVRLPAPPPPVPGPARARRGAGVGGAVGGGPELDAPPPALPPATITGGDWTHTSHYHPALLREVPRRCDRALDVGCGDGVFARKLASLADRVDAIDSDGAVLDRARDHSPMPANVSFILADFLAYPVDAEA